MIKFLPLFLAPIFAAALPYELNIVGLKDEAALKSLLDVSTLVTLQDRPPASINGIRYRAASDIPALLKVLRAYAYYDATIDYDVENKNNGVQVSIFIHPGPQYKLASYQVYQMPCTELANVPDCSPFTPERLGLSLDAPAVSVNIVNAELKLLTELARCGYPLASVEKRKIEVDMAEKIVDAASCIQEGPLSKFGPITLFGLKTVKPRYIEGKIIWKEGQTYNPDAVEETQKRLLNSDLFSSVMISHGEEVDAMGELPMKMRITEAKHRQVSIGAFYATVDGPGVSFAWVNRNVRGMGEIVDIEGDFSKRFLAGSISYKKPDFFKLDQTYRLVGQVSRESIHAYIAFIYRGANYLERKFDLKRTGSIGFEVEHINVANSASNGTYLLAGLPIFARYGTADSVLDPTKGYSFVYQVTPYQSLDHADQHFIKQRFTTCFYIPMTASKRVILAFRFQLGSIAGAKQHNIPLPKLFLGGSEDDLRGYRYKTVSPLNIHRKPFGGRSAVFATVETRFKITKNVGIVPFADFGTVTFKELPQFNAKWFKSVGVGLRYYTFFGPLRLDVGFPLDRRRIIDPAFRLYASIGQTF